MSAGPSPHSLLAPLLCCCHCLTLLARQASPPPLLLPLSPSLLKPKQLLKSHSTSTATQPHAHCHHSHSDCSGPLLCCVPAASYQSASKPAQAPAAAAAAADDDDDDDDDFMASLSDDDDDGESDAAAQALIAKKNAEREAAKRAAKGGPTAKSSLILDIKPEESDTDMDQLLTQVKHIEMEGLTWGGHEVSLPQPHCSLTLPTTVRHCSTACSPSTLRCCRVSLLLVHSVHSSGVRNQEAAYYLCRSAASTPTSHHSQPAPLAQPLPVCVALCV